MPLPPKQTRDGTRPETGVFVPPSALFPELRADQNSLLELLRQLSKTDTLFWCARLNLIVSGSGDTVHKERQQQAMNLLCTPADIERVNGFARLHGGADWVTVFFRGQLLELLCWASRYCIDLPGDGDTFEDPTVRRRFVQAALIASQLWGKRVFTDRFSMEGGIQAARLRALGPIRKSIEEAGTAPELTSSLGRGWVLFTEYFPRRYVSFASEFLDATGLTVEEYFTCVATITVHYLKPAIGTPIFEWQTAAAATPYFDVFPKYVLLESQLVADLPASLWEDNTPVGYRSLREQPILRTIDGRAIVLDPVFYSERASVGPLFHLLRPGVSDAKANQIFGAFGLAVEDYVADMLKRMYPTGDGTLLPRLGCNVRDHKPNGQLEVDAVLNDVTELVMFETKAAWIREDHILGSTHEEFLEHLRLKYGVAGETANKERVKGVGQLARIVDAISNREWLGPQNDFGAANLIYPVLLVHDGLLGAPVYGDFLASEFTRLLRPTSDAGSRKTTLHIAPLTIMTVEDLEHLESSVEHFGLRELLAAYSREHPDRLRSLRNFIALSPYANQIRANRHLATKAAELFRLCQNSLFPDTEAPTNNPSS